MVRMTIDLRVKLLSAALAVGALIFAGLLLASAFEGKARLASTDAAFNRLDETMLPLERLAAEVRLEVTQVQQYLSDVSATRALDGLDDGFKEAAEHAAEAEKHIGEIGELAQRLGDEKLVSSIGAVATAFGPYYRGGIAMAKAYVAEGPAKGNTMMPGFDAQAEALRSALDGMSARTKALVQESHDTTTSAMETLSRQIDSEIRTIGILCIGLLLVSVGLAIGVRRMVLSPILAIADVMARLAHGDLSVNVPFVGRSDEVGTMAEAVQVFRTNGLERARLEAEQAAEQEQRNRRTATIDRLVTDFDRMSSRIARTVADASKDLQISASTLTAAAEETTHQSTAVSSASEEASANVETVATSTTQMAASIQEISARVDEASRISAAAVGEAQATRAIMSELEEGALRIGEIVGLISEVAGQTNLLALNATIEAARAGEAGRGFAVVAAEVKGLADQTAKASGQISTQIGDIQNSARAAVEAIRKITTTIDRIDTISGAIAAAIEEQTATTQEISRNVQQVSVGTAEVAANITGVTRAAEETSATADQVRKASTELADQSVALEREVASFLRGVRAA